MQQGSNPGGQSETFALSGGTLRFGWARQAGCGAWLDCKSGPPVSVTGCSLELRIPDDRASAGLDVALDLHGASSFRLWLGPIVEAMRPDFSEVQAAAEILAAAQDADWGPIRHDGKLHDRASYRYYWELLQRARATGVALPDDAIDRFF